MDIHKLFELGKGRAEDQEARRAGLQGVPTFIVNGKFALSGAHLPEVLHQMFDIGLRDDEAAADPGAARALET